MSSSKSNPASETADARTVLRDVFGHPDFRPGQAEAVDAAMLGKDVAVLLPTGGGKSLCYQVPAVARARAGHGPTLVVSPLIALMQDQVRGLRAHGVSAAVLNSTLSASDAGDTLDALRAGDLDLLYVSPERAAQPAFRRTLSKLPLGMIAIDEAHCVSQWGHDFRPEYMQLAELREISNAPMMAVTATATPRVLKEITRRLGLGTPVLVRGEFARPNLRFSVEHIRSTSARLLRLRTLLQDAGLRDGAGLDRAIVYCSTRKQTESVAADLQKHGFVARHYNGGRTTRERERAQRAFASGRITILVATNAFGMGIDLPNVRRVIHYSAPGSLEAYYQEAGRAGRDGDPAECVMFFGKSDLVTQGRLASNRQAHTAIAALADYAQADECRQRQICAHFGDDDTAACGRCDVCRDEVLFEDDDCEDRTPITPLSAEQVEIVIAAVGELSKPAGKTGIARALRGSRAKAINKCGLLKISQHGKLRGVDERAIVQAIEACLEEGTLVPKGSKYPTVWLPGKPVRASAPRTRATPKKKPKAWGGNAYSMLQGALERFRKRKARELKWKPYMVFQKRTIVALDDQRPKTLKALSSIPGLGHAKVERFGSEILQLVRENP